MSSITGGRRRYGDQEVALILRRATDLQRDALSSDGGAAGLSLPELEEIASEAGIDPVYLRRAAAELDTRGFSPKRGARIWGAALTIELERIIERELSPSGYEELIPLLNQAGGGPGTAGVVGRTLTWSATSGGDVARSLQVTVTSKDGETRIFIEERLQDVAGALFGGIVGGGGMALGLGVGLGVGLGALGSAVFATVFPVAALGGTYFLARTIYAAVARRRRLLLGSLLDRITEVVQEQSLNDGRRLGPGGSECALPGG